ncbi:hypothetical protein J3E69DRAFT_347478 [Trichoderma sp. SZMC 28015]
MGVRTLLNGSLLLSTVECYYITNRRGMSRESRGLFPCNKMPRAYSVYKAVSSIGTYAWAANSSFRKDYYM